MSRYAQIFLKIFGVDVGDGVIVEIEFDKKPRIVPMPAKFADALAKNKRARAAFKKLTPSRQKEINLYLGYLKTEESIERNIKKIIRHLTGKKTSGVLFTRQKSHQ